jgi:glycosyltransferase involved in cell wall biosynthesis
MGAPLPATAPPDGALPFEPLVSVVIPVYNRAHLIARAISSALTQSYKRVEIIVVDDASTDGLGATLAVFADTRLRCVTHPVNRGAAGARNTGVEAARGEFVAFLDSDDFWYPDKLAHQIAAMRDQSPEVAGHVCAYDCIKIGYPARRITPNWRAQTFRRSQLFGCTCGPGTTLLCRRDIFAAVGPLDEKLRRLEDWDWLLRLSAAGYRLLASPEVLARVEVGPGAATSEIDAALQLIRTRHYAAAASQGPAARRIFEATLYFESAAAAFSAKAYGRAARSLMRSLACYPPRGATIYSRLIMRGMTALNPHFHRLWAFGSRPAR